MWREGGWKEEGRMVGGKAREVERILVEKLKSTNVNSAQICGWLELNFYVWIVNFCRK